MECSGHLFSRTPRRSVTMKRWNSLILRSISPLIYLLQLIQTECEFPRPWWGRWHQPQVGAVTIRSNDFSTKGTCYEKYRDYYLVENRGEHCHQCLLIIRRHTNVIQYRESYCIGRGALQSICSQIIVERFASMHTIIREDAFPVSCPLLKAFHFTYKNQSGGFCRSPTSYAHQCSSSSRLRFNFRHCRHNANAFDKGVELECLATWKDGLDNFVYGQFVDTEANVDRDHSYRCLVYQKIGSVVNMAVSSDSTCQGLRGPKEGPLVIEMTEDVYGWPSARCTFPAHLNGTSWIDISGTLSFAFNTGNDVIAIHSQRKHGSSTAHARATIKCLKVDVRSGASNLENSISSNDNGGDDNDDDDSDSRPNSEFNNAIVILAHVLEKCQSRHRCFLMQRRHDQLLHLSAGSYVHDSKSTCTVEDFLEDHTQHFLLMANDEQSEGRCPLRGRFVPLRVETGVCQPELRIGCIQPHQLEIVSTCSAERPLLQLSCLLWWKEHSSVYLVARRRDSNQTKCYHLQHHHSHFTMHSTDHCSRFNDHHRKTHENEPAFAFQPVREKCSGPEPSMKKAIASYGSESEEPSVKVVLGKETLSKREQQLASKQTINPSVPLSSSVMVVASCFTSISFHRTFVLSINVFQWSRH